MSPMEWCLCEKLPRAVLHIPLTADKKCDLCGLPRRPRSGNSSSSDEEGERRQRMLAERRRAEEACKGKVRVKVAMSAKKPKPSKTCGKCGGTQKLATCQVNESNVNHKVYAGRFGHYKKPKRLPMGSMAGQTYRGEAGGAEPNGLLQEKQQQQEELPPRRSIPNTRTHESLWEPTSDMPRLVAMAHEVFNRPMHMRQRYYSSLFVSDFIPLTKPITDRTCGAISKRRTGGRAFMEHRSRPLPPLSKVLADMRESREREEELEANMRASGGGLAQPTTSIPSSAYSTQFLPFNSYEGPSEDALVVQSARSLLSRPNSLHITPRTDLPCTRLPTFESESSSNCSSPSKGMQSADQSEIFCPTQQFYFMRNSAPLNDELLKAANHARASTSSSSSSSESSPQLRTAPRCSSSTLLMKQCALSTAKKPLISLRVRGGQCATTSNIYLSSDDAEAMHKKWQFPEPKANPSKSNSLLGKLDSIWMLNKSNSYSKTGEDNGKKNHVRFADDPVFIFPHEPDSLEPQKPLKSISLLTNKFISHTDLETEQQRCLNLMHTDSLKRDSSVVRRDLNHLLESLNLNDRYEVEDSNLQTQVTLLEDEPSDLATPDDSKGLEHLMSRLNIKGCTDTVNSSMEMSTENEASNHHTPSVGQTNLEQMFSDLRIADCNKTEDSSMETEVTPLRADDGHDFEIKEQPDGVGHYVVLSEISNDLPVNLTNKLNDDECYPKGLSPGKQECRIHKLAMEKLVRKPNGKLSKQLSPSMWSQFVDLFTPRKRTSCNRCGMKKSKENSTLSTKICPIVPKRNQCTSIELSDARTVAPKTSLYSLKIATARTNIRTPPPKKIKIAAEPAGSMFHKQERTNGSKELTLSSTKIIAIEKLADCPTKNQRYCERCGITKVNYSPINCGNNQLKQARNKLAPSSSKGSAPLLLNVAAQKSKPKDTARNLCPESRGYREKAFRNEYNPKQALNNFPTQGALRSTKGLPPVTPLHNNIAAQRETSQDKARNLYPERPSTTQKGLTANGVAENAFQGLNRNNEYKPTTPKKLLKQKDIQEFYTKQNKNASKVFPNHKLSIQEPQPKYFEQCKSNRTRSPSETPSELHSGALLCTTDSNETSTNESYRTCPDSGAMPQKVAEKAYPEKYSFTKVKMNRYPTTATVKPRTVKPPKPLKKRKSLKEMKTKPLETQTWHFVKIIETVHHKCTEIFFPKMLAFVRDIISTTATATWQYKEYISGESTLDFYEFRAPDVWLNDIKVDEAENDLKKRARQLGRYLLKQQQNRQMEQTGFENELFETWMSADKRRATMVDKETQLGSDCSSTYQVPGKRTKQDQSKCRSRKKSKPEAPVWPAHPFRHKKRRVTKVASSVGSYASDEDDDKDTFESSRVQSIPDYKLPDNFKKPLQLITTDVRLSMTKTLQSVNNKGIHGLEPAEYTRQEDSFDDNRLSATPDSISDPESPNTFKKPLQLISTNVRTFKISKKILEPIQYTPQEDNYSLLQQQLKESMLKPIHLITSIGVTVPKSARPAETIRPTIKAFQSDGSKTHLLSEIIPAPETMNGQRFQQNLQTSSWQMIALEATSERFENNINSCQHACPVHNCTALLGPDTLSTHFIQMHRYKGTSLQESYHRVLQGYPRQFTFDSQHLTEENSFIALLIYSRVTNGGEQSSSLHDQPYVLIGAFGEFPNLSLNQECSLAMVFWLVGYTTPVPLNATLTVHSPCNGVGRSRNILPIGVNATQDPRRFVKGSKDYFLLRTSTKNHGLLQISIVMKEQSEASELLGH